MIIPTLPISQLRNTVKRVDKRYPKELLTIGDHIRKRRLDLKLQQKEVAKILGVHEMNVHLWEINRCEPMVRYSAKVIAFLEYNPYKFETETIGGKIKTYRYQHGLTLTQFGKLIGVDTATISNWETGLNNPRSQYLEQLREYVG